jgi:hypothetical protein
MNRPVLCPATHRRDTPDGTQWCQGAKMANVHYLWHPETVKRDPPAARESIGINELDSRLQEQLAEYGSIKEFRITLWRDERDPPGCNWNARVDRIRGEWTNDSAWWDVVPQLRQRFNLA